MLARRSDDFISRYSEEEQRSQRRNPRREALSHLEKHRADGIWTRRGLILEHYEELIRVRGEDQTLY